MKKLKIILSLAATVTLVLLCASLPKLVSVLVDVRAGKKPVYNNMQSVELELNEANGNLPIMAKLSLWANGKTMTISAAGATKTEEEIKFCAEEFMDSCRKAGLYQYFTPEKETVSTKLIYDVSDSSKSMVVWRYFAYRNEPKAVDAETSEVRTLELLIDDETGKVLSVTYDHYGIAYSQDDAYWEQNRKRASLLTNLYLTHLGLIDSYGNTMDSREIVYGYQEVDMGVIEGSCTVSDPTWGTVSINFVVGGVDTFRVII